MSVPPEFYRLGSCFLQDDYEWGMANLSQWATRAIALSHLPPSGVRALKLYIDDLLANENDEYIESAWWSSGAAFAMRGGGGVRAFLKTVRQLLDTVEIKSLET